MLKNEKQKEAIRRLNRVSGQVEGIKKMIGSNRYCIDVITQVSAARAALNSLNKFILEDHLKTCVSSAIVKGAASQKIKEIVNLVNKF